MKINLACFIIGLLLGIFLSVTTLVRPALNHPPRAVATPAVLRKEVAQREAIFAQRSDSLAQISATLEAQLSRTKKSLSSARKRTQLLEHQVRDLALYHADMPTEPEADADCDSLHATLWELLDASAQRDSLCDSATNNLQAQVQTKETALEIQAEAYSTLKTSFTQSLEAQQQLSTENHLLQKQLRRQKTKGKFFKAALFLVTAATGAYLITH